MLLSKVVATASTVAATWSRLAKVEALADLLRRLPPEEVPRSASSSGALARPGSASATHRLRPHGRTRRDASLTVADLDHLLDDLLAATGTGLPPSVRTRCGRLGRRATADEQLFVDRVLIGEMRPGRPRRGARRRRRRGLRGPGRRRPPGGHAQRRPRRDGRLALTGGADALEEVGPGGRHAASCRCSRPPRRPRPPRSPITGPRRRSSASSTAPASRCTATATTSRSTRAASRDHRTGCPRSSRSCRTFPATQLVLDGETLALDEDGGPARSRTRCAGSAREAQRRYGAQAVLLRRPPRRRRGPDRTATRRAAAVLDKVVGAPHPRRGHRRPRGPIASRRDALAAGHEGVMVKALDSPVRGGRRGKAWRKVKPVHTLDLVVLGAEWGSGRRKGWLSNLHLGARDPDRRRVRHGGQDVQGADRRDARLADRAASRPRDPQRRSTSCTCGPSWSSRSPSTASRCRPAIRAVSRCGSPASRGTATDKRPEDADTIQTLRAMLPTS